MIIMFLLWFALDIINMSWSIYTIRREAQNGARLYSVTWVNSIWDPECNDAVPANCEYGSTTSSKLSDDFEKITTYELSFTPEQLKIGHDGEFAIMSLGSKIATLDMEARAVREWNTDSVKFGWIDNDMIYSVADGELVVYDFDGLNRRVVAKNATGNLPATISGNKWLYYFDGGHLMRKVIAD